MISKEQLVEKYRDQFFGLMMDLIFTEARGEPLGAKVRMKQRGIEELLRKIHEEFSPPHQGDPPRSPPSPRPANVPPANNPPPGGKPPGVR